MSAFVFRVAAIAMLTVIGCDTITTPNAEPSPDGDPQTQQTDDDGTAATDESAIAWREAAAEAVVNASEVVAQSVASVLPIKDLQAVIEGGLIPPSCPTLLIEPDSVNLAVTLDYGTGCSPTSYPQATFAGAVDGTAFIAVGAFDLSLNAFEPGESFAGGAIAGSYVLSADTTRFIANIEAQFTDGTTVNSNGTIDVENATGLIIIPDATVHLVGENDETFNAIFTDVVVDPATNGNFLPRSGTATVTAPIDTSTEPTEATITLEFTDQTAINGRVD